MNHRQQKEFSALHVKIITDSDSRDLDCDKSGQLIAEKLIAAGHHQPQREVVVDTIDDIRQALNRSINSEGAQVVVLNGGTGVTPRDQTIEAIEPLFDKQLPGFGELFRHLSFAEIGAATIQSRATAGIINGAVVFSLPGSTQACRLAMDDIILPQLDARTKPCSFSGLLGL